MWLFLMTVALLDHSRAAPVQGEHGGLQLLLQEQVYLTSSTTVAPPPRRQSSSSSSSSSSASSESSQSSEGPQQMRERQNLENAAVEQVDSQESSERLQAPSNTSSLRLNELVLLGERASDREKDAEDEDTGDDSVESRHRALMLTYHHLLSRPRHREAGLTTGMGGAAGRVGGAAGEVGGAAGEVGGAAGEVGGAREENVDGEFPRPSDDSREGRDGLTVDLPGLGSHGDEAGLELGL